MKKRRIFQHQYQRQVKICTYLYLFHDWFPLEFVFIQSISLMYKCLLKLIKRRSKVQENMSWERTLNFDQLQQNQQQVEQCFIYQMACLINHQMTLICIKSNQLESTFI